MASSRRVAVVTGANKGIGYAIVRGLCKQTDADVFLTGRNEQLCQEAVKKLNDEGFQPKFHQLDLNDTSSIERFKNFLQSTYGGIDILVNNAGMAYKVSATEPFAEQVVNTVNTNFWGTLNVCKSLFPLLRPHARVVNVSSRVGNMSAKKCSKALVDKFMAPGFSVPQIEQLLTDFVRVAKDGTYAAAGWPESAYGPSKIGVTLMTFAHQREFDKDPREDIVVNACCPGYVNTDMTSGKGSKTLDEGADTPLYLALIPPNASSPRGQLVAERNIISFP